MTAGNAHQRLRDIVSHIVEKEYYDERGRDLTQNERFHELVALASLGASMVNRRVKRPSPRSALRCQRCGKRHLQRLKGGVRVIVRPSMMSSEQGESEAVHLCQRCQPDGRPGDTIKRASNSRRTTQFISNDEMEF